MGILQHIDKTSNKTQLSYFDKTAVLGIKTEEESSRPSDGFLMANKDSETVLSENVNLIMYRDLWNLSKISDVLQIVFNTRARKTFREGFDIEPMFERANKSQKKEIESWIKKCNQNGQSIKEVFHELDKDLNWADDAYLLCLKDYGYNAQGEIVVAEVKEFVRMHPLSVELQMDFAKRLGRFQNGKGNASQFAYFSPRNRHTLTTDSIDKETGQQNMIAHYRISTEQGFQYYNSSELMHKSAFNPSLTYGYSPLFSLYQKVLVLMLQDSYIKKYYGDDKPTKGLLVFNTANKTALMKTFDEIRTKTQQNPHGVKPIIAESSDGRKPVEYIDMAKTLDEMQYTNQRDEYRQQVGAMYGVQPMFQNDMSTGGGLNNEGLQVSVTNEVIQDRQELFNNSFLEFMFKENLGYEDWNVTVKPDIEQDLMAEEQLTAQELANAQTKLNLGLKGRMTKDAEIVFDAGELELQEIEQPQDEFSSFNLGKMESVKKAKKVPERKLTKLEKPLDNKLTNELKDLFDELKLKGKVTEDKLLDIVKNIGSKFEKVLKKVSSSVFKGIYEKSARDTNKQLKEKTTLTELDKQTIEGLKSDEKYQEAFANLSEKNSDRLRETITEAYDKPDFDINKLVTKLQEDFEITKSQMRNIVRTETGKISSASRKTQLDKTGVEYTFTHIGPAFPDNGRTTVTSKNIMSRTKNGVSWDDYVKIVKQESKKEFPEWTVNPDAVLSHYQSRHIFSFRRVEGNK